MYAGRKRVLESAGEQDARGHAFARPLRALATATSLVLTALWPREPRLQPRSLQLSAPSVNSFWQLVHRLREGLDALGMEGQLTVQHVPHRVE